MTEESRLSLNIKTSFSSHTDILWHGQYAAASHLLLGLLENFTYVLLSPDWWWTNLCTIFFLSDSLMNIHNGAFKLYFMVTPLITPWKRKHIQALIMQQDCTWMNVVQLIWYRLIPPCWCTSPVWIPSPAPKLDLHSPQGVSIPINVAGPNIQELIQLWSEHYHICLTLHLHFVHPPFFISTGICVRRLIFSALTLHLKVSHLMLALSVWRRCDVLWSAWRGKGCDAFFLYEDWCNQNLSDLYRYLRQIWHQNITSFSKPASVWRTKIGKRNSDRLMTVQSELLNKMMEFGFLSWLWSLWGNQDLYI